MNASNEFNFYLPEGFAYINDYISDAIQEIRYYSINNFLGTRVDGYEANIAILTHKAATALKSASDMLREQGFLLKIYDAYRPQKAVNHFVRWANDMDDAKMKAYFYPDVCKKDLFKKGYIAFHSSHSRGSTIDLTLVDARHGVELDMGSPFDFFGEISNWATEKITKVQYDRRILLKNAMLANGFRPYDMEWWHYTLIDEPYTEEYFDFNVR